MTKQNMFWQGGFLLLLSILLMLAGCGGGGGDKDGGVSVTLSASPSQIQPGASSTLHWESSVATRVVNATGFDPAGNVSGSVSVSPTLTTTYSITVADDSGNQATATTTVGVGGAAGESYAVIGSDTNAEVPQIQSILQQNGNVSVQNTIPSTPNAATLVLHQSGSFGPDDQSKVVAWLNAGKGVVVIGAAARKISSGDVTEPSVTNIGAWFGGVTTTKLDSGFYHIRDSNPDGANVQLPNDLLGQLIEIPDSVVAEDLGGSAQAIATYFTGETMSFSFARPTGGRVFFISHPYGTDGGEASARTKQIFRIGSRWAATGG